MERLQKAASSVALLGSRTQQVSSSILTLKQSLLSQRELCQQESDRRHQLEAQLQNASAATLSTSEQVQAL